MSFKTKKKKTEKKGFCEVVQQKKGEKQ